MANSGHDVNYPELNVVFRSLGERGKEAQLSKDYYTDVTSFVIEQISEFLSKETENQIMVRAYGSAAEDLKCLIPEDYGDLDVMIFPNADDSLVYDDLLEDSSDNPLHAKIKGSNHPMLRSCLLEGTEYVATSAVKKLHPAIYGTAAPGCIDRLTKVMQAVSREDLEPSPQCLFIWRNKENSPAITIETKQPLKTQPEEFQKLKDAIIWNNLDVTPIEGFINVMNCATGGIEYTREHAEALDDYCKRMRELLKDWVSNSDSPSGLFHGFPAVFQEMLWGNSMQNFKARIQAIESRLENENKGGSRTDEAVCVQQSVTPEVRDTDKAGSSTKPLRDVPPFVTSQLQNSDPDGQMPTEELKSNLGFHSSGDYPQFSEESVVRHGTIGECEDVGDTTDRDHDEDGNECKTELKNSTEKGEETSEDRKEEDEKKRNARIAATKRMFQHMLGLTTKMKGHDTEKSKEYKRKAGIDIVPALRSRGWPKVARGWIKRDRRWPSPEMVDNVIHEGFHLVVKPPKANGNPDCDFRISFSHAEYLLSQEMNDIQRECYRCLKKYHRAYLSKPTGLVTFHLKNLLLQTIEETGAEMWTESNRAECMMKLLGNLLEALTMKDLRHFFVRDYNLFGVDYIDDPKILEVVAREVEKIIDSPVEFSNKLIQTMRDDESQIEKEESVPSSKPTTPARPVSEEGLEGTEKASRPGGNDDTQNKKEKLTFPVLNPETTQGSNSTPSYRYHDLQDIYLQVSKEVIDMAFNDANLKTLDPLERYLVEGIRELASIHGLKQSHFLDMLKDGWVTTYYKVFINTEPDMRRRMLDAIHGQVEMLKYALKQEDFAPENMEAIAYRMMNPSSEDDPFDLNLLLPAGGLLQYLSRLINSPILQLSQQQIVNMVDIPLD